jgi:hypothetical protein
MLEALATPSLSGEGGHAKRGRVGSDERRRLNRPHPDRCAIDPPLEGREARVILAAYCWRESREQKDTGRRVTDPNFFSCRFPGAPCAAILGVSRPASSRAASGDFASAPRRSQPVEAGGPVVVPDGRATRRLHLFHASRFSPRAGVGQAPFGRERIAF